MIAQQRSQACAVLRTVLCEDGDVPPLLQLANVVGMLEAQPAESDRTVIGAVAIEVDHVIGLLLDVARALKFVAQDR